jgi:hypothetical protein
MRKPTGVTACLKYLVFTYRCTSTFSSMDWRCTGTLSSIDWSGVGGVGGSCLQISCMYLAVRA